MKIVIEGVVPEGQCVYVSCCEQTQVIDSIDKQATFSISVPGDVTVIIKEIPSKNNHSFAQMLIFWLTALIQGAFNILLMNVDSEWYKHTKAYCLKAMVTLDVKEDTHLRFRLSQTTYVGCGLIWKPPNFSLEPNVHANISFYENFQGISNAYFTYVKRIVSVSMVVMSIFVMLLFVSFLQNLVALIVMTGLIIGELVLVTWLIQKEYRRYKKLFVSFQANQDVQKK